MSKENIHPSVFSQLFPRRHQCEKLLEYTDTSQKVNLDEFLQFDVTNPLLEPRKMMHVEQNESNRDTSSFQSYGNNEENSPFKTLFYGKYNVNLLQAQLKVGVYNNTGYVISNQSVPQLLHVMKKMETAYSNNPLDPDVFIDEIMILNKFVINYCLPKIISEIKAYKHYLRDINQPLHSFPERSKSTAITGTKNNDNVQ